MGYKDESFMRTLLAGQGGWHIEARRVEEAT